MESNANRPAAGRNGHSPTVVEWGNGMVLKGMPNANAQRLYFAAPTQRKGRHKKSQIWDMGGECCGHIPPYSNFRKAEWKLNKFLNIFK